MGGNNVFSEILLGLLKSLEIYCIYQHYGVI